MEVNEIMDILDPFHMTLTKADCPSNLLPEDIRYNSTKLVEPDNSVKVHFTAFSPREISHTEAIVILADAGYPSHWYGCWGFDCTWLPEVGQYVATWEFWDDND